jgi:prepilin-type N-terminal cleavage/methylation domain-containing protein
MRRNSFRKGFTLIEILVVIVIIGILATMGIGKYSQFTRDARRSGCVNNQNTIDKSVGMWEARYVAFPKRRDAAMDASIQFDQYGKLYDPTNLPSRLSATGDRATEIADITGDEMVFICPETIVAWGGMAEMTSAARSSDKDYEWRYVFAESKALNNKKRGTICLVFGSEAAAGTRNGVDVGGAVGPGGTDDINDLHSGSV